MTETCQNTLDVLLLDLATHLCHRVYLPETEYDNPHHDLNASVEIRHVS